MKRLKQGFAILELIVAIGVIVALGALGVSELANSTSNFTQTKLDSYAEIIFTAAQNRLTELRTTGRSDEYEPETSAYSENVIVQYIAGVETPLNKLDKSLVNTTDELPNTMCYVVVNNSQNKITTTDQAYILMPNDRNDTTLWNGNWIIEYDYSTAAVYGVYFSETPFILDETPSVYGYYGGGLITYGKELIKLRPHVNIENGDDLIAVFSCNHPSKLEDTIIEFCYTITPINNDKVITECAISGKILSNASNDSSTEYIANLTLDSLNGISFIKSNFEQQYLGKNFYIEVTARALKTDTLSTTDDNLCNSLFASVKDDTAYIGCTRHLQNLNNVNGISNIVLKNDISLTKSFIPITNEELINFYGNHHTISKLVINTTNTNTGLFGIFGKNDDTQRSINNLTLNAPRITVNSDVIGYENKIIGYEKKFVGYNSIIIGYEKKLVYPSWDLGHIFPQEVDDLTKPIYGEDKNNPIYDDDLSKPIYSTNELDYTKPIYNDSNTGALIGYAMGNLAIRNCSVVDASIISYGKYAGGLVGVSNADITLISCSNIVKNTTLNKDIPNVCATDAAGGLIGLVNDTSNATLTKCSTNVVIGNDNCKNSGGLIGKTGVSDTAVVSQFEAYVTAPVDFILVLDQSGSMAYNYGNSKLTRQEALKQSATNFITLAAEQVCLNNTTHRMAIVGFSDDAWSISSGFVSLDASGAQILNQKINQLRSPSGGTYMDAGLEEALSLVKLSAKSTYTTIDGSEAHRDTIIVFFTDGYPGSTTASGDYFSAYYDTPKEANDAVAMAAELKKAGATIYCVGAFENADPSANYTTQKSKIALYNIWKSASKSANGLMHFISSDYDYTCTSWMDNTVNNDSRNNGYYYNALDYDSLEETFRNILSKVTPQKIEINTESFVNVVDGNTGGYCIASDYAAGMIGLVNSIPVTITNGTTSGYTFGNTAEAGFAICKYSDYIVIDNSLSTIIPSNNAKYSKLYKALK